MLTDPRLLAALQELVRRLPGGKIGAQSIGAANALRGMAYTVEYPAGAGLLLLFLDESRTYRCEFMPWGNQSWSQSPPPEEWSSEIDRWEAVLGQVLVANRTRYPAEEPENLVALSQEDHQVLAAALVQRMRTWKTDELFLHPVAEPMTGGDDENATNLKHWYPAISVEALADCARRKAGRLDFSRLPATPVTETGILEFYRNHPEAHGRLFASPPGYRPDRNGAVLILEHSLGFDRVIEPKGKGSALAPPDGPLPDRFYELLVMERRDGSWQLVERLDPFLPLPPEVKESREKERLQRELGDWATVEQVVLKDGELREVLLRRPDGPWRVFWGEGVDCPVIVLERSLWICRTEPIIIGLSEEKITGAAIRAAFDNSL